MANNNNGNNGIMLVFEPVEIPAQSVAKLSSYYGLLRNLAENSTNVNGDLILQRSYFSALSDNQYDILAQIIENDIASPVDRSQTYRTLFSKVFRVMERYHLSSQDLEEANNAASHFYWAMLSFEEAGNIEAMEEDEIEENKDFLEEGRQMVAAYDPRELADAVVAYRYLQRLNPLIAHLQLQAPLDQTKPILDYLMMGQSQEGGRRRKMRRTRKLKKTNL